MFKNFIENLKDIFAADPCAKGADEQRQGVVDIAEEEDDIDSFFRAI